MQRVIATSPNAITGLFWQEKIKKKEHILNQNIFHSPQTLHSSILAYKVKSELLWYLQQLPCLPSDYSKWLWPAARRETQFSQGTRNSLWKKRALHFWNIPEHPTASAQVPVLLEHGWTGHSQFLRVTTTDLYHNLSGYTAGTMHPAPAK